MSGVEWSGGDDRISHYPFWRRWMDGSGKARSQVSGLPKAGQREKADHKQGQGERVILIRFTLSEWMVVVYSFRSHHLPTAVMNWIFC